MKVLFFSFIFLASMHVSAWTGENLTVDYIDVKGGGSASVYFTSTTDAPNPKECSQVGTISWEGTNESSQNFLSTFLAAKMSDKQVQIIADSNICLWGGWPSLVTVRIK